MPAPFSAVRLTYFAIDVADAAYGGRERNRPLGRRRRGSWRRLVKWYVRSRAATHAEVLAAAREIGRQVEARRSRGERVACDDPGTDEELRFELRARLIAIARTKPEKTAEDRREGRIRGLALA